MPTLSADNRAFWPVFERILPGLFREQGYDYGAIRMVFQAQGISRQRQAFYLDKCLAVIDVIHKMRKKPDGQ